MLMSGSIEQWLYDPVVGKLITAVIGVAVIYALVRFLQRSVNRYVAETETRYRTRKLVTFIGSIAAAGVLATVFSERLTGLTVAFGVAGAGIAFALQEIIASVAGWVAISFGGFYRTGDRVQLGGIRGDVIDIGVLRTTLMEVGEWVKVDLYNGRIVRVANSFVFKEPVFNYSGDFPFLWDEITFPVKYGSDWKFAREVLQRVAEEVMGDFARRSGESWKTVVKKYLIEDARVEPMITLRADENWVEFTVRYIVDYKKRRTAKDLLFTRILEEVEASDGRIQIASAAFEITNVTPPRDKPAH
jgi:small-conductance mechanosensitive channel